MFLPLTAGFFDENPPPRYSEEVKRLWAKEYISRKYELLGKDPHDVSDDVIELQYREHEVVAAVSPFYIRILWAYCNLLEYKLTNDHRHSGPCTYTYVAI